MNILSHILQNKIIAIIRGVEPKHVPRIVQSLYKGGIRVVEITLNSENAFELIRELSSDLKDKMAVGAGTVLDVQSVIKAIDHGAKFIISPSLDIEVIKFVKQQNLVSIPGAFTATEIVTAYKAGADIIKVFPAINPQYIKDLSGPLSHIPLMPTGGISLKNIDEFQKTGAVAFGIGNSLVNADHAITEKSFEEFSLKAGQFMQAVHKNQI